jgi:hypothetical protein
MKKLLFASLLILSVLSVSGLSFGAVPVYNPDYTYGTYQTPTQPQPQYYQPRPQSSILSGVGPYIGVQGGFSVISGPQDYDYFYLWNGYADEAPAWRGFVGFNIIKFLAVEGGFSQYGDTDYPCNSNNISSCSVHGTEAWDIMGKIKMPIKTYNPNIDVEFYLKAGAAYVTTNMDIDLPKQDYSNSGWTPAYGAGVTFYFYRYVGLDLSWYGFYGQDASVDFNGVHGDYIPRTNLFSLGLIFKLPLQ